MLLLEGKSFFRSQKDLKLIYLWASIALELWLVIHFQHQNSICRVTGDGGLVFPPKLLLDSLSICCCLMENHFSEVKKPQTHLLMSFNSITIMAGDTFSTPKINMWSDCWWWLGVSNQTIVIYTFNMLLLDGKSFFKSQKDFKLIYLWASIALELWLVILFNNQKSRCGVTGDGCLVFPAKLLLYSFLICYCLMENYITEVK